MSVDPSSLSLLSAPSSFIAAPTPSPSAFVEFAVANVAAVEAKLGLRQIHPKQMAGTPAFDNGKNAINGFVDAVIEAYNHHHRLEIRPDDLWLAILVQLSLYVAPRAEKMRSKLVKHQGTKNLRVTYEHGPIPFDDAMLKLRNLAKEEMLDQIADWTCPDFTTTDDDSRLACAMALLSIAKSYFRYEIATMCGIPSIRLMGTVEDWVKLRRKVDDLGKLDAGDGFLKTWQLYLARIVSECIAAAEGRADIDFWSKIVSVTKGSGVPRASGWITSFAVFDRKGEWQCNGKAEAEEGVLKWSNIELSKIPIGVCSYPVFLQEALQPEKECVAEAGHGAMEVVGGYLRPKITWCVMLKKDQAAIDDEDLNFTREHNSDPFRFVDVPPRGLASLLDSMQGANPHESIYNPPVRTRSTRASAPPPKNNKMRHLILQSNSDPRRDFDSPAHARSVLDGIIAAKMAARQEIMRLEMEEREVRDYIAMQQVASRLSDSK